MLITFIDDLVSFDGHSADSVPLGGPEKNLISLAVALASTLLHAGAAASVAAAEIASSSAGAAVEPLPALPPLPLLRDRTPCHHIPSQIQRHRKSKWAMIVFQYQQFHPLLIY